MVRTLSISFRNDELNRIAELMTEYSMNRHQVIKLAVRRFLFPHEKTVPLGEKKLSCTLEPDKKVASKENQDWGDPFADEPSKKPDQEEDDGFPF